ncbi:MAG: lipid-A-disaccharide synthase [Candidatus Omnitrophica bacterium]|nr:lipid-A-disaccharide synthase [Candidatus Omnitrophota bacterium]
MSPKKIFIVAGESSGDARAAEVIRCLQQSAHSLTFEGLGGQQMASCGVNILYDLPSIAAVGFTDVIKKYPLFRKIFYTALKKIKETRPDVVILVDYPGFNLRLAKEIKKLNIPVIYYISPQIWAWASWRKRKIAEYVNKMLVILPFEVDFYDGTSLPVEFVGHPLIETFVPSDSPELIRKEFHIENAYPIITLLSGSREAEVKKILPIMVKTAELITKEYPTIHFLISKAPDLPSSLYEKILAKNGIPYSLVTRNIHDLITAAHFCWVASGTATLEAALGLKPFIILYKASWLTYILAKHLIMIPYIGLVNIIAGKKIIPEFLQNDAHPETIAHETKFILNNPQSRATIVRHLEEVRKKLGPAGAARRAAKAILNFLEK